MRVIKKFSQIILIGIFLSSCKTSINEDNLTPYSEDNLNENINSEKRF